MVLLSGGLDSAVVTTAVRRAGVEVAALSFDYGQRHDAEVTAARRIAAELGVTRHEVVRLAFLGRLGQSTLTDQETPVLAGETRPSTCVPGRNLLFIAHAVALAETVGASVVLLGSNADDARGYPDCRPAFMEAVSRAATLGTRLGEEGPVRVTSPLLEHDKASVVRVGLELGAPPHLTWSCYSPQGAGTPCGQCDACHLRASAFATAEARDGAAVRA